MLGDAPHTGGAAMALIAPTQTHAHWFSSPSFTSKLCQSKRGSTTHHRSRERDSPNWKRHRKNPKIPTKSFLTRENKQIDRHLWKRWVCFFSSRTAFKRLTGPGNRISLSSKCRIEFHDIKLHIFPSCG